MRGKVPRLRVYKIQDMIRVLILLTTAVLVSPAVSADTASVAGTRYLGLAVPVPQKVPELTVVLGPKNRIINAGIVSYISIDDKGEVINLEYPPDSAAYISFIEKDLRKLRFDFMSGMPLAFPVTVPAQISYFSAAAGKESVNLTFPISPDTLTDSTLLNRFFARNNIVPPRLISLPPVFYKVDPASDQPHCLTITARVFIDDRGQLTDITFPVPGMDRMTHQVHVALMNAEFTPAIIQGRPLPSDFLVTFRIFDNLRYPFSPFDPPYSADPPPITARYFLTQYFNEADIHLFPVPRSFGDGYIRSPKMARLGPGIAMVRISIGKTGKIVAASAFRATPGLHEEALDVIKLTTWYPAVDRHGETIDYEGVVSLSFNRSSRVVYIPEWMTW